MKKLQILFLLIFTNLSLFAQDVMMQGWYWDYFNQNNGGLRWAKHLATKAPDLKKAGFTYLWLPPASRTSTSTDVSNGYNPSDLFDYGSAVNGQSRPTMLGSRAELNNLISTFNANNIKAVADLVYNHRDGGKLETNPALKTYMDNLNSNKDPFPCDRMVLALPLGAQNPGANVAGDYYFKFSSKTGNYGSGSRYNLLMRTSKTTSIIGTIDETEPNGGSDCGQAFNTIQLGQNMRAYLGAFNGCNTDEFKLSISPSNLRDNGTTKDTLWIYMTPLAGGYADQRPYAIWSGLRNSNIVNELNYMTFTNFNSMPSGMGAMNYENFRPNTVNAANNETLRGDENAPSFYSDYDQSNTTTKTVLNDWTKWNWNTIGMRGFRIDAVKHFSTGFLAQLFNDLNANNINPGMVVGENYDGNPAVLKGWIDAVKSGMNANALAAIQPRVFDFALRGALRDACDTYGYDVRNVYSSGYVNGAGGSSTNSVTFVNNHDFRSASGWSASVQNDPMLAYAYILTNNKIGLPCVFYPDYYGASRPFAPTVNLQSQIDTLMALHKKYIFGATQLEFLNQEGNFYQAGTGNYISGNKTTTLIYQIKGGAGGKDVIVAINFSGATLKVDQLINGNGNPTGTRFYDMMGRSPFTYSSVMSSGKIYLEVPPRSFSVWVKDAVVNVQAKVLLNTADAATGLMPNYYTDPSNAPTDFPLSDPYSSAPLNANFIHKNRGAIQATTAAVLATTGVNAIVDWVFVELRTGTSGATSVVYTKAALLQSDGDIVGMDGVSPITFNAPTGNYFVTIRHRNSLGFRTLATVAFPNSQPVLLNFSNNSVPLFGASPLAQLSATRHVMHGGDANSDGSTDSFDTIVWESQNGLFTNPYSLNADYNLDGSVDALDSILWEAANGKFEELE